MSVIKHTKFDSDRSKGGYGRPSIIAKLVIFAVFGQLGTTVFTDHGEVWYSTPRINSLIPNVALIEKGMGTGASPNLKIW